MANLKRSLIKVSGSWPETISGRAIASSINAMTPDTFGEIDPLASLDHFCRRQWRQFTFLEPFRDRFLREKRDARAPRNHHNPQRDRGKQNELTHKPKLPHRSTPSPNVYRISPKSLDSIRCANIRIE